MNSGTQIEVDFTDLDTYPNAARYAVLTGAGQALQNLQFCSTSPAYVYVENPGVIPAAPLEWLQPATAPGPPTNAYALFCPFHCGIINLATAVFPQTEQLWVTQDGVARR